MTFTESNTVEQMILDAAASLGQVSSTKIGEKAPKDWHGDTGGTAGSPKWDFVAPLKIPRQPSDVLVETWIRQALINLNPEIAAQPDRADEVIYALRAILLAVGADGLVRANENFTQWLRGEKTMPFGPNGEHVAIRLLDFSDLSKNRLSVTNQ